MADDSHFKNPNAKMTSIDEFHRASTVYPYHHPSIQGSCNQTQHILEEDCEFKMITVTENVYNTLNDFTSL